MRDERQAPQQVKVHQQSFQPLSPAKTNLGQKQKKSGRSRNEWMPNMLLQKHVRTHHAWSIYTCDLSAKLIKTQSTTSDVHVINRQLAKRRIIEVRETMCFVCTGEVDQRNQHGLLYPYSPEVHLGPVLLYVAVESRSRGRSEAGSSRQVQGAAKTGLASGFRDFVSTARSGVLTADSRHICYHN